jgi:hypothetical protein
VYARTKSYYDTNAEDLDPTATETQWDPSKGAEEEETARTFKLECHQKELDQCSIDMKRLISRNTFKTNTRSYGGLSEQYVQEVMEQYPYHQDKKSMEVTRQPQYHLGITGPDALYNTGSQGFPCQSHTIFHSSQYARLQDAPEAMVTFSSHEQMQVQMTFPKEAKENSQDSGYSTAPVDEPSFPILSHQSLYSRCQDSGCAGGYAIFFLPWTGAITDDLSQGGKGKLSRFKLQYCARGYGQIWADDPSFPSPSHQHNYSRCQDSGCAGGYGQIIFSWTGAITDDPSKGGKWNFSGVKVQ